MGNIDISIIMINFGLILISLSVMSIVINNDQNMYF